jgi:hypothetical protein
MAAFLLPLTGDEPDLVLNGLVALANQLEEAGDKDTARRADELADRLRALSPLVFANAEEWLRCVGVGRTYRRPQG